MKQHTKSLAIGLLALIPTMARAAEVYSVADLGVEGRTAVGAQINNRGHVIFGLFADPSTGPINSFFYRGGSTLDLSGMFDSGAVVNDSDTLIGVRPGSGTAVEVFRYTPPGMLGPPDGVVVQLNGSGTDVVAENNSGSFVGSTGPISTPTAYLSTASGQITNLATLGGDWSYALAINNSNQVVGVSKTSATLTELFAGATSEEAFLYSNGKMVGLGTLGGQTSYARSINDAGQIVGDSSLPNDQFHAFFYDANGGMQDIGPSGLNNVAYSVNNLGIVAGQLYDPLGALPEKGFLFDQTNGIRYINDLVGSQSGWTSFLSANGINDRGQVVGTGVIDGEVHIFLLTPVPEPPSAYVCVLALAIVLAKRRTQRRAN